MVKRKECQHCKSRMLYIYTMDAKGRNSILGHYCPKCFHTVWLKDVGKKGKCHDCGTHGELRPMIGHHGSRPKTIFLCRNCMKKPEKIANPRKCPHGHTDLRMSSYDSDNKKVEWWCNVCHKHYRGL